MSAASQPAMTFAQYNHLMRQVLDLANQRDYAQASRLLEAGALDTGAHGQQDREATILSFLGSVYQRAGRYAESEEVLNRSINLWTRLKGPDAADLVGPLANLGALYFDAGQFTHAEQLISRALQLQLSDPHADSKMTAMLLTNLGSVYFAEEKSDEAQAKAEEALQKFSALPDPIDAKEGAARNYALLGAVSLQKHELEQAEKFLKTALAIWESVATPDDPRRAEAVANVGILYSTAGSFEKAEAFFKEADAVFQSAGGNDAYIRHFLAEYYAVEQKLGRRKEAKQLAKRLQQRSNSSAESMISRNVVDVHSFQFAKK